MSIYERLHEALVSYTPLRHRSTRKRLVHARRRAFEALGSPRYSRPAPDDIDHRLERHLPPVGVFLEAGANDGYTWSNTYYLERFRGWRGVLIEGIPALSAECRKLRRRSVVYNCALVGPDFPDELVTMTYSDLRSLITGSEARMQADAERDTRTPYEVRVPARTLDDVLEAAGVEGIDFVSLDLEGFEAPALRGLDLERHRPRWLLVEVAGGGGRAAVEDVLGDSYEAVEELTATDVLYHRRGPS
jgi:FkbM family methyltransferase